MSLKSKLSEIGMTLRYGEGDEKDYLSLVKERLGELEGDEAGKDSCKVH